MVLFPGEGIRGRKLVNLIGWASIQRVEANVILNGINVLRSSKK